MKQIKDKFPNIEKVCRGRFFISALIYTIVVVALFLLALYFNARSRFESPGGGLPRFRLIVPMGALTAVFVAILISGLALLFWLTYSKISKNESGQDDNTYEHIRQSIRNRYQTRFFLILAGYSAVIMFFIAVFYLIKESRTWYTSDPFYPFFNLGNTMFPWVMAVIWLSGAAVALYRVWRQNSSDITGLLDSIGQMLADDDNIDVPENLREILPALHEIQSESRRNRQAAKEAERRKSELIVYLAHDLKTPLTSVIGYLNLLREKSDMTQEQRDGYTQIALNKAVRLESLIAQFFEISRFNLEEMVLDMGHFDLRYLFAQLSDEFYPLLAPDGKKICIEAPDELWLTGDAEKLARVFNNLLRNAISYSKSGSEITIYASQDGNDAYVQVINQGETIPSHQLDSIFEQFYRLDEARATNSGGSGLGLAIAKEIVAKHDGSLTAQSEDGVTVFTVMLPLRPAVALLNKIPIKR